MNAPNTIKYLEPLRSRLTNKRNKLQEKIDYYPLTDYIIEVEKYDVICKEINTCFREWKSESKYNELVAKRAVIGHRMEQLRKMDNYYMDNRSDWQSDSITLKLEIEDIENDIRWAKIAMEAQKESAELAEKEDLPF